MVLLSTLIVMLIISEFALRIYFRDVKSTSENLGYFDETWRDQIRKNSWGFRERNFDLTKPEGVYRIAVIGDSITFGQGVGETNRYTNLLEEQLNDRGERYEVLNFGIRGAETVDHLRILNDPVLKTNPDFILLQWYTNDVEGHDKSGRPKPLILIPNLLREHSAFCSLIHGQLNTIQRRLGWVDSYEDYMASRFGDPNSPSSIAADQALEKLVSTAKEYGIPIGIVLYITNDWSLNFLADRVLEHCVVESITCIHLGDMFEPYKEDPSKLWASELDAHPGALAHRLIAERLMDTFGEVWLSKKRTI
jgi:lysophospholipase L1-like esterase